MNKKQRHQAKVEKRKKQAVLARALREGYSEWASDLPKIRVVKTDGGTEVQERVAKFLVAFLPKLGTRVIHAVAKASVVVSPAGVTIDFNDCARAILREQARRAA